MKKFALAFVFLAIVAGWGYADFAGTGFSSPSVSLSGSFTVIDDAVK